MEDIESTEETKDIKSSNNNGSSQKQLAGAIIIAGIIIAGAILIKGGEPSTNLPTFPGRPVSSSDHIVGNIKAKIVIVEYSDFECPYCKVFHNTMKKVVENSNGDVAWVYRHFPIASLHSKAFRESEASECAWEQGGDDAFWKYTDRIFSITPSNDKLDLTELTNIATFTGLDLTSFTTCLDEGKVKDKVQADIDDGIKAGVTGTPSSFILKKDRLVDVIPGNQPYEAIMKRLETIK